MQDDVTDATLWAVEQGYAERTAFVFMEVVMVVMALMGVIREPDLYQCSVGYVGVSSH